MTDLSYNTRTNWFSSHKLYCRLSETHLNCSRGWNRRYAYNEIDEIRILCFWSRYGQFSAQTMVNGSIGKVTIPSFTEESLGISECKGETYLPFMEGLIDRVRKANPDAKFTAGSNPLFFLNIAIAAAALALAIFMSRFGVGGWPLFAGFALATGVTLYAFRLGYRHEIGADEMLRRLRGHVGPAGSGLTSMRPGH